MKFCAEGINPSLKRSFRSYDEISEGIKSKRIYEGRAYLCDSEHNLHIDLGCCNGIIPKNEGALGILEGSARDIALISKVGKDVCFRIIGYKRINGVKTPVLSRRSVQLEAMNEYINHLKTGDIISAKITKLEGFGAFIDIGAGINSLIPIDMLSVSRISHPRERLREGDIIKTVLKSRENGKLTFSLKELLGTWEENAAEFSQGDTVTGTVRGVEQYGVFVELAPNLAGLAEANPYLDNGQTVSVFIKSINPEKMKIKLSIVDAFEIRKAPPKLTYFVNSNHLDSWYYSPPNSSKQIYTLF